MYFLITNPISKYINLPLFTHCWVVGEAFKYTLNFMFSHEDSSFQFKYFCSRADARANQARKEAEKEMEMRHNQNMQMLFDEEEEERQQQLIMMQQQQQQQHMGGDPQQDATKNSYRVSQLNLKK